VLSERVLEYQFQISEESGANFCTQESQEMCSGILQSINNCVFVGLPGAGGDDALFVIYHKDREGAEEQSYLEEIQSQLSPQMAVLPVGLIGREGREGEGKGCMGVEFEWT